MPRSPAQLFDLTGRAALVTGSSKGLGWAMAEALAAAGATVALNARDPAALSEKRARLLDAGLKAEAFPFDASDPEAAAAGLRAVVERYGRLDVLVANTAF